MEQQPYPDRARSEHGVPRYEPWLGVSASTFIPIIAIFVLPERFTWLMIALSALLLATGVVMLLRQERRATNLRSDA
jgi:hypothetical protein